MRADENKRFKCDNVYVLRRHRHVCNLGRVEFLNVYIFCDHSYDIVRGALVYTTLKGVYKGAKAVTECKEVKDISCVYFVTTVPTYERWHLKILFASLAAAPTQVQKPNNTWARNTWWLARHCFQRISPV